MPRSSLKHSARAAVCITILYACGGVGGGDVTVPDSEAPTVSLTRPTSGAVTGSVILVAEASDDREVAGVRFQVDGEDLAPEDTEAPYEQTWNTLSTANGPHTITAIARDAAGNIGTSAPVAITVTNVVPVGSLEVTVVTTGPGSDPDGYTVLVDGAPRAAIGSSATTTISDVAVGAHSVQLGGAAAFCGVTGATVQTVNVVAGATTSLAFAVYCARAPTGQILFNGFTFQGIGQIVRINPDGSSPAVLQQDARGPAWSHDRGRIAFERDDDIYAVNADGSGLVQLTNTPESEHSVRWSPDDGRLLFYRKRDGGGPLDVFVMQADGAGAHPVFGTPAKRETPAWSPDGSRIVFALEVGEQASLWTANADGSGAVQLTSNAVDFSPAWSPDGGRIAYRHASEQGGSTEIYVIGVNGTNPVNLTQNQVDEYDPEWSPDGEWIAFISNRASSQALWIMRADGSMPQRVSSPASFQFTSSPTWR
jgi:hypothetical protein